jgi:EAL domain-containing protein (putative c-di-GMP-specific phosphodiesterase class I)
MMPAHRASLNEKTGMEKKEIGRVIFPDGAEIFRGGEAGTHAYLIEQGKVEIFTHYSGERVVLRLLGPGDILGDMALLDNAPRSASAVAIAPTTATVITRDQLVGRLEQADPVLRLLLNEMLARYRRELRRFKGQNVEEGNPSITPPLGLDVAHLGAIDKIKMEGELRQALDNEDFKLYFQPIIHVQTGHIAGFEALIRWFHSERGFVSPGDFIPVAEETDLIVPIGRWVMREACRNLKLLQDAASLAHPDAEPLFMSINVSGRQFSVPGFIEEAAEIMDDAQVDPSQVKLEITETLLMSYGASRQWVERCREMGTSVALDDFGTGYSSLSYLLYFPIDVLKIDRAFVQQMSESARGAAIVASIVSMAHNLDIRVVAEGIEEPEQLSSLAEMACDFGQGYYMSRPLPVADVLPLLGCLLPVSQG